MSTARDTLTQAMTARDEAEKRVTAASDLALKAAGVVSDIERRRIEAEQVRNDHIADRAAGLRKALSSGEEFHKNEVRSLAAPVLREIEEDLAIARHAHADLVREQEQAQYDLASAEAAANAAVYPCVLTEADTIADQIEELEARARELRVKLHGVAFLWGIGPAFRQSTILQGSMGPLMLPLKISKIINSQAQNALYEHGSSIAEQTKGHCGTAWRAFADALKHDASAVLDYQPYQPPKPDPSISPPPSQRFEDRREIVPILQGRR